MVRTPIKSSGAVNEIGAEGGGTSRVIGPISTTGKKRSRIESN